MSIIRINGYSVEVNIEEELRQYPWRRARWTPTKLVASSPFRTDNTPSFFVNLETGGWADSGSLDPEYMSGNFVKLLGYLRGAGEVEAAEYLLEKYGVLYELKPDKPIRIPAPKVRTNKREEIALTESTVRPAISPYLLSRGITAETQTEYGIGYNPLNKGYTAIPWHYHDTGEIANVKYRSTSNKHFFYEPDAKPVSELLYGLYQAKDSEHIIVVEGEIDALSWAVAGLRAVAIGGAYISDRQVELLKRAGFKRIYLAGDNDEQGRKLNGQVVGYMRGYVELYTIDYGEEKDANDVLMRRGVKDLRTIYSSACPVPLLQIRVHPHG